MKKEVVFGVLFVISIGLVLILNINSTFAETYDVTVYRDVHGIPHLYADNEEALFYAMGYVKAEDQIRTITFYINRGKGTLSSYEEYGKDFLESDIEVRLSENNKTINRLYENIPENQKNNLKAFVEGINQYIKNNPTLPDDFVKFVSEKDILLANRGSQIQRAIDRIEGVTTINQENFYSPASNALVVSGSKTSTGNSMAYFEPHLSMLLTNAGHREPYAMHINLRNETGTVTNTFGMADPYNPAISAKFNDFVAIGGTSNSANDFEVYEETLDEPKGNRYFYDGEWLNLTIKHENITYWDNSLQNYETRELTFKYTPHGPIIYFEEDKPIAYSVKFATAEDLGVGLQIISPKSVLGVKSAIQNNPPGYGNHLIGDNQGDIYYVSGGKYPVRNLTFDENPNFFDKPVPGNSSLFEWQGFHTNLSEFPELLNPESGFIENCNDAPQYVTLPREDGKPYINKEEKFYPNYILRDNGWLGQRGRELTKLVADEISKDNLSLEELMNIALNDKDLDAISINLNDYHHELIYTGYLDMLDYAFEQEPSSDQDVNQALNMLEEWNGSLDKNSTTATLYLIFKRFLGVDINHNKLKESLTASELSQLRSAFVSGVNFLNLAPPTGYGGLENLPTLGDITIMTMDGSDYHIGLGNSLHKLVGGQKKISQGDYTFYKNFGALYTLVVELSEPVQAYLMKPYPQNENPESKHNSYIPQKFADNEFVEVYFDLNDIENHLDTNIEENPYTLSYEIGDEENTGDSGGETSSSSGGNHHFYQTQKNNNTNNDTIRLNKITENKGTNSDLDSFENQETKISKITGSIIGFVKTNKKIGLIFIGLITISGILILSHRRNIKQI